MRVDQVILYPGPFIHPSLPRPEGVLSSVPRGTAVQAEWTYQREGGDSPDLHTIALLVTPDGRRRPLGSGGGSISWEDGLGQFPVSGDLLREPGSYAIEIRPQLVTLDAEGLLNLGQPSETVLATLLFEVT